MNHQQHRSHNHPVRAAGFTIVELMIVVAVLGIIAGIAIPGFVHGRVAANETAVIGSLRAIATGQFKFKTLALVDVNGNGAYEFGTMAEMTGEETLRGSANEKLTPSILPMSLTDPDEEGRYVRHGYYFALYLPDDAGLGLSGQVSGIDADLAAEYWSLVAWPVQGNRGEATFFINQQGEIVKNDDSVYHGTDSVPPAGAALLGTSQPEEIQSTNLAINETGADGQIWTVVN